MIHVDQATQADVDALVSLSQHVHQLHLTHAPRFFLQPTVAQMQAALHDRLAQANACAFIARADDVPAGYVLAFILETPATPFTSAQRWLYVDQISVAPQWQRHGVGRLLMQKVVELARAHGIDELDADTWAFNEAAQAFFEACGFRPKMTRFWMQLDK